MNLLFTKTSGEMQDVIIIIIIIIIIINIRLIMG